jgi:hypothetical protein
MDIRKDIFGEIPKIGDTIIFNPPKYKGLVYGICDGFVQSGLPKVVDVEPYVPYNIQYDIRDNGYYTPKTGFVVKKSTSFKDRKIDN